MQRSPVIPILALIGGVVAVQLAATLTGREYYLTQLIMSAYYTIVVCGLCLVMGYAGQLSLGHGAFFALGGYTTAVLTTLDFSGGKINLAGTGIGRILLKVGILIPQTDLYGRQFVAFAPGFAFCVALLLTLCVALFVGYPALRLRGHYLAMATLGFGLIVYRLLLGTEWAGSADGISSVPAWRILPGVVICGKTAHRVQNYYVAWGLAILVLCFIQNLVRSRTGRALRSIHDGELAANAMGIHTAGYKLKVFVLSAGMAGVAGSFLTHYNGGIGPSEAGAMKSVRYVTLVAAGGMANVWGVLMVGSILTFLSLRGCFGSMDHAVFGAILILIMSFAPQGPLKPLGNLFSRLFFICRRPPPHDPSAEMSGDSDVAGGGS